MLLEGQVQTEELGVGQGMASLSSITAQNPQSGCYYGPLPHCTAHSNGQESEL